MLDSRYPQVVSNRGGAAPWSPRSRLPELQSPDPARYEIELTETALLGNDAHIAGNVEALKRLGCSIALDDFGTGYSSLSVLQRWAVDRIKIDRSSVMTLARPTPSSRRRPGPSPGK